MLKNRKLPDSSVAAFDYVDMNMARNPQNVYAVIQFLPGSDDEQVLPDGEKPMGLIGVVGYMDTTGEADKCAKEQAMSCTDGSLFGVFECMKVYKGVSKSETVYERRI